MSSGICFSLMYFSDTSILGILVSVIGGLIFIFVYIYLVIRTIKKAVNESEEPLNCELLEELRDK